MKETVQYDKLISANRTLKRLVLGEWCDCDAVLEALGISFAEGLRMFEFSRTVEWNPLPLNGQHITTKFRLRKAGDDI